MWRLLDLKPLLYNTWLLCLALPSPRWSALTVWPQGVLVRHGKLLYRALGIHNVAIPGDSHHGRFFVSIRLREMIYSENAAKY